MPTRRPTTRARDTMTGRGLIHIAGALTILRLVPHHVVPLAWGDTLSGLTRDQRAIVYELAYGFAVLLALVAYLSLCHADDLLTTRMAAGPSWSGSSCSGPPARSRASRSARTKAIPIAVVCLGAAVPHGIARARRPPLRR